MKASQLPLRCLQPPASSRSLVNASDWWNLGREPMLRCRAGWEMQFLTVHLGEDGRLMWDFTHIQGEPSKDSWESSHRAQESTM